MFDLESARQQIKNLGDDVSAICEKADEMQAYGFRVCPRNIYQDETAKAVCCTTARGTCRKRFATCFKKYFAAKRNASETPTDAAPPTVWYVCDRKKCVHCDDNCKYTSDITHAANFTVSDTAGTNGTPFGFVEKLRGGRRK